MEMSILFLVLFFILCKLFFMSKDKKSHYEEMNNFFVKITHKITHKNTYEDYMLWHKEKIINEIAKSYESEKIFSNISSVSILILTIAGVIVTTGLTLYFNCIFALNSNKERMEYFVKTLQSIPESYSDIIGTYINMGFSLVVVFILLSLVSARFTRKIKILEAVLKCKESEK